MLEEGGLKLFCGLSMHVYIYTYIHSHRVTHTKVK